MQLDAIGVLAAAAIALCDDHAMNKWQRVLDEHMRERSQYRRSKAGLRSAATADQPYSACASEDYERTTII